MQEGPPPRGNVATMKRDTRGNVPTRDRSGRRTRALPSRRRQTNPDEVGVTVLLVVTAHGSARPARGARRAARSRRWACCSPSSPFASIRDSSGRVVAVPRHHTGRHTHPPHGLRRDHHGRHGTARVCPRHIGTHAAGARLRSLRAGVALTLDEFALILRLEDVYWLEEDRRPPVMMVLVAAAGRY